MVQIHPLIFAKTLALGGLMGGLLSAQPPNREDTQAKVSRVGTGIIMGMALHAGALIIQSVFGTPSLLIGLTGCLVTLYEAPEGKDLGYRLLVSVALGIFVGRAFNV